MRPGNYVHERWFELSMQSTGRRQQRNNKHWRLHRSKRRVCLTGSQARIYDYIVENDGYVNTVQMFRDINPNLKSLSILTVRLELIERADDSNSFKLTDK